MTTQFQWAIKLDAIGQNGLIFANNDYDRERYQQIREISAEILESINNKILSKQEIINLLSKDIGYATPKVDVRAAIFKEKKLLFVKEKLDGLWSLPGGWADVGESAKNAVEREVYEETGLQVAAVKLLAFFDKLKHEHPPQIPHAYKVFFLCEIINGTLTAGFDIDKVAFFSKNQIPELSQDRITKLQIERLYYHFENPNAPTDFD